MRKVIALVLAVTAMLAASIAAAARYQASAEFYMRFGGAFDF